MRAVDLIRRKRDGEKLSTPEITWLIQAYIKEEMPDYQMAALAMAIYFRGLDGEELAAWTRAMLHSGEVMRFEVPGPVIDKHSTGGVGDKTSLVLAPLCAAAGIYVPMISGRGLGHTGGTLDKLESIPGFDVALSPARLQTVVARHGMAIVGQTAEIVPADRRLYALRDVTATVNSIPLIASSVMSKKLAEGLDGLVLDVKVGSGAFMGSLERAQALAREMVGLGQSMGVDTRVLITDMDQPLGLAIGNALEVREAIDTLQGRGPADLVALVCELAAEMMHVAGVERDREAALARAEALLSSGEAFEVFCKAVAAQGGDEATLRDPTLLPAAERTRAFTARRGGFVRAFECKEIGLIAMTLGAGRQTAEDVIDHGVGLVLHKKRGEAVEAGEAVATIHYQGDCDLGGIESRLIDAIEIGDEAPVVGPMVLEVMRP